MHILQFPLKLSVGEKILEDLIVAQTNLLKILETSSSEGLKSLTLLRTADFALNLIIEIKLVPCKIFEKLQTLFMVLKMQFK